MSVRHRVAFGTDDRNECVAAVLEFLRSVADVEVAQAGDTWPEFSRIVGEKVAGGEADFGVLMCWTGTGTAMAANKVKGVRAAQAWDPWIAESAPPLERRQRACAEPEADRPRRRRGLRAGLPRRGRERPGRARHDRPHPRSLTRIRRAPRSDRRSCDMSCTGAAHVTDIAITAVGRGARAGR